MCHLEYFASTDFFPSLSLFYCVTLYCFLHSTCALIGLEFCLPALEPKLCNSNLADLLAALSSEPRIVSGTGKHSVSLCWVLELLSYMTSVMPVWLPCFKRKKRRRKKSMHLNVHLAVVDALFFFKTNVFYSVSLDHLFGTWGWFCNCALTYMHQYQFKSASIFYSCLPIWTHTSLCILLLGICWFQILQFAA